MTHKEYSMILIELGDLPSIEGPTPTGCYVNLEQVVKIINNYFQCEKDSKILHDNLSNIY